MILSFDDFTFDPQRLELMREGVHVRADRVALRVLCVLLESAGHLVTKDELIEQVWSRRAMSANIVSVTIARLRKTLGHRHGERELVVSVQGRGYRFVRPVTASEGRLPAATGVALEPVQVAPPFVGREAIVASLQRMLASASAGRGGVGLLTGEPGIGKTAAAEQLAAAAERRGMRVAWAYCADVGETPPLWPFTQLVRARLAGMAQRDLDAVVPELATLLPELRRGRSDDARPVGKHRLFEAVLAVLECEPAVLVIDDLHRADAASIELLRYWMDRLARTRVLVVATLRPVRSTGALADIDLAFVVGHPSCVRLALARLEPASVLAYVTGALPGADEALSRAVWAKSEGNPFFMVELTRQLADAPRLGVEGLRVSSEALQLLKPRVAQLDAATHGLLAAAAVIGRRFELRLLQKISGRDLAAVTACLEEAAASEAIVADARTAYAFGHDLIRESLYDELEPAERRRLHLSIGEALQERATAGEAVASASLAYHFHAALPAGDPVTTLSHCQRAAFEATMMFAHEDSIRHVANALEALSMFEQPNPMLRLMLLFQQAVSARIACVPGFERLVHEAAQVARAMHSGAYLVEVGLLLHLHPGFPTLPHARALLEEGLALLGDHEHTSRGAALARLATSGPVAFDARESHAQLARALALTGTDALLRSFNAYSAACYRYCGTRDEQRAAEIAGALAGICQSNPQMLRTASAMSDLHAAMVAHQAGRIDDASVALVRVRTRCREMGLREFGWHAERYQLLARLQHVAIDEVAAELRALHARAHTESVVGSELMCAYDAVVVLQEPCDAARLGALLAYSPDDPPSIWSIKVQTLAAAGCTREAGHALAAVPADRLAALPHDRDYLGTLGALTRAALMLVAREHAAALYRLLTPHAERLSVHVSFFCLGPVAQLLGELAVGLGRSTEALAHFAHARAIAERLGLRAHVELALRSVETVAARESKRLPARASAFD